MIKKDDKVEILPEFRDEGDETFTWVALDDEEKGRVVLCPVDHPMRIKPSFTVLTSQIRRIS